MWTITQMDKNEWHVTRGDRVHYAQTAEDAVKLMLALTEKGF
jgi:L-lactate utilization protein LutB